MKKEDKKKLLAVFMAVLIVGVAVDISEWISAEMELLVRNEIGGKEKQEHLTVSVDGESYSYDIDVEPIHPTQQQAEDYFKEAMEELEQEYMEIGDTVSVRKTYADGTVSAEWSFSPWNVIDAEGRILFEQIPKEGVTVTASVQLTCGAYERTHQFPFWIAYREKKEEEQIMDALDSYIESEMQKEGEADVLLPKELMGKNIVWSKPSAHLTIRFLILEAVAGIALGVAMRQKKAKAEALRSRNLERDYTDIVAQLALLIGSGMSIRQAWKSIAVRYMGKREKGQIAEKEAYEGITRMIRRISEGENEKEAYQKFALETQNPGYYHLIRLLIGNIEKGSNGIREILEQECRQAYEQRVLRAKKLGEEASTRMLIPLMLMMLVVMAIVLMPAMMEIAG